MANLTANELDKIKDFAIAYMRDDYLSPGQAAYFYEECDDPEDDLSAYVSVESCPRSDEEFDRWEEIQETRIVDAEIGEVDGECVEVKVEAEITWASGSGSDDEASEEETQNRIFLVTVVARPDGPYIDRVEE